MAWPPVTRTATRHITIEVEADSREEAMAVALEEAGDHEFPGESEAEYDTPDGATPIIRRLKLSKYENSTFIGEKIQYLLVNSEGQVYVHTEHYSQPFYIDEKETDCSGDYILCLLQNEENIKVTKF